MVTHLLESGEYVLGSYKVQRVNWVNGEWFGAGQWLRALVTNRRLLIVSDNHRRDLAETIVPPDIRRVWNLCLGRRDGILVALNDGRRLYMLVDWSQGNKLVRDINEMLTPPLKPRIAPRLRPM
ncbi:MAG: hypothetical protein HZC41_02775 [Chloroflexi bacterium]|nr:hypothetical protein [Chloroflexota bacterium]